MSATDAEADGEEILGAEEIAWPPEELEIELRKPVEFKGEVYDRLRLREPTVAQWEKIMAEPRESARRFAVSLVAGVPMAAVGLMGIGDIVRAEEYLSSFFEAGQKIRAW
jgi:hypothetical protein